MALPIAHAAGGYVVYEAGMRGRGHELAWLALAVVAANAPDFDFLPGFILGDPARWHRGISHTLAGLVVVSLLAGAIARWLAGKGFTRVSLAVAACYASHLVLDYFTADSRAPYGVQFLWPLSAAYYHCGWPLLAEVVVDFSGRGRFLASLLSPAALRVWLHEAVGLALVVALARGLRWARASGALAGRGGAAATEVREG